VNIIQLSCKRTTKWTQAWVKINIGISAHPAGNTNGYLMEKKAAAAAAVMER
jgi:hypothetical protein